MVSSVQKVEELQPINANCRGDPIPNAPTNEEWCGAIAKGKTLFMGFFLTAQEAGDLFVPPRLSATTEWDVKDAADWGWNMDSQIPPPNRNLGALGLPPLSGVSVYGIARALTSLGKSDKDLQDGGNMKMVEMVHFDVNDRRPLSQQTYRYKGRPTGRQLPYTGGSHTFGYSTKDGVIVNLNLKSVAHMARQRNPPIPDADLPDLKALSDLQWAAWAEASKTDGGIDNLQWYFIASIQNVETRKMIRGALILAGGTAQERPLEPWPGVWIPGTTNAGLALLGSQLGKTLGYLLLQHKPSMGGNKWVDGVVIFHGDTTHQAPCLAFHISNAAPRPLLPGEPDPNDNFKPHYSPDGPGIPDIPDPRHGNQQTRDILAGFNISKALQEWSGTANEVPEWQKCC